MHEDEHATAHDQHGWTGHEAAGHAPALDLGEEERLPWLESADDIETEPHNGGHRRLFVFGVIALIVLALLVDGIYWATHRGGSAKPADGSLIAASKDPYKVAPSDPGGKQFAGTGDASFKVSHGEHPDASLAGSAGTTPPPAVATPSPSPAPSASAGAPPPPAAKPAPAPAPVPAPAHPAGGSVAVQVGAYSSNALAEAGWNKLSAAHDLLKGVGHRVVEGKADIGTVYRLQALAGDTATASNLCSHLEADGVKCQVKK
ncbi:SPOR domain-containing protein [Novosphingobium acidiphilum]|jgi:hypothetical protein|uniref:SPOR domain-containing protein n=1 Tax=Novosphingobium acidiphilum TaxID=505248 RepID=UPI000426C122|nr:SPOR domain-containing protein [Novosphingobium acidiphilum]